MNILCWIFGHKWILPFRWETEPSVAIVGEAIMSIKHEYVCSRCGRKF